MKNAKKVLALVAIFFGFASFVFATDPVIGYWVSYDDESGKAEAGWQIWEQNGKLYGKIVSLIGKSKDEKATGAKGRGPYEGFPQAGKLEDMTVIGTTWIYDLQKKSEGNWEKGFIVDPKNGKRYKCKIVFHKADGNKYKKDTLQMRGEIGAGIGRNQWWLASTEAEAMALK